MARTDEIIERLHAASAHFTALGGRLHSLALDTERELQLARRQVSGLEETLAEEGQSAQELALLRGDVQDLNRDLLSLEAFFQRWL